MSDARSCIQFWKLSLSSIVQQKWKFRVGSPFPGSWRGKVQHFLFLFFSKVCSHDLGNRDSTVYGWEFISTLQDIQGARILEKRSGESSLNFFFLNNYLARGTFQLCSATNFQRRNDLSSILGVLSNSCKRSKILYSVFRVRPLLL